MKKFYSDHKEKSAVIKLEKSLSVKCLTADFGVGMSTIYTLEPKICPIGSEPSHVMGPIPVVEFETASDLCVCMKYISFLAI
jgi:hypothetical protein